MQDGWLKVKSKIKHAEVLELSHSFAYYIPITSPIASDIHVFSQLKPSGIELMLLQTYLLILHYYFSCSDMAICLRVAFISHFLAILPSSCLNLYCTISFSSTRYFPSSTVLWRENLCVNLPKKHQIKFLSVCAIHFWVTKADLTMQRFAKVLFVERNIFQHRWKFTVCNKCSRMSKNAIR